MKESIICQIEWIDCNGKPTPDTNVAVGSAICNGIAFAICADHLVTLQWNRLHHSSTCKHFNVRQSVWHYTAFDNKGD